MCNHHQRTAIPCKGRSSNQLSQGDKICSSQPNPRDSMGPSLASVRYAFTRAIYCRIQVPVDRAPRHGPPCWGLMGIASEPRRPARPLLNFVFGSASLITGTSAPFNPRHKVSFSTANCPPLLSTRLHSCDGLLHTRYSKWIAEL